MKPAATAIQRLPPTRSPNTGPANTATSSGATNMMEVASARGRRRKPSVMKSVSRTRQKARTHTNKGRCVRNE